MSYKHLLLLGLIFLTQFGCTAIKHRNLETQLQLQQAVFLNPDSFDGRPVFLHVSNQTGKSDVNFDTLLTQKLTLKGYIVTNNPKEAGIRLLVNFVYLDKAREGMSKEGAIAGGFGGALFGAAITRDATGAAVGAATGAAAGGILGVFVTVDTWYGVVDVMIEEPLQAPAVRRTSSVSNQELGVTNGEKHSGSRGSSSTTGTQSTKETSALEYQENVRHKKNQTRIVVEAVQTNIDSKEASKQIRDQLADSIANFL